MVLPIIWPTFTTGSLSVGGFTSAGWIITSVFTNSPFKVTQCLAGSKIAFLGFVILQPFAEMLEIWQIEPSEPSTEIKASLMMMESLSTSLPCIPYLPLALSAHWSIVSAALLSEIAAALSAVISISPRPLKVTSTCCSFTATSLACT